MVMSRTRKGFTLIEILVVVAIVAILSAVIVVGLGPARRQGRDARRITDIKQIQTALELYYNKNGQYPTGTNSKMAPSDPSSATAGWGLVQSQLIGAGVGVSVLPDDPTPSQHYIYDTSSTLSRYVIGAKLEDASNPALTGSGDLDGAQGDHSMDCGDNLTAGGTNPIYCISSG